VTAVYGYTDSKTGALTNNIQEIVSQEVELLAYAYVEKHGKAPSKKQINNWINFSLTAMGWYDDD